MSQHSEKMHNLLTAVVRLTKVKSDHHFVYVETLAAKILQSTEEIIKTAALSGQTKAYIFVYALGSKYNDIPIYDYLFPNNELADKLAELKIESVFHMIQKYFEPFEVEHKIFQIPQTTTKDNKVQIREVETPNTNLFQDGTLAGDKYIGTIIVSWSKNM